MVAVLELYLDIFTPEGVDKHVLLRDCHGDPSSTAKACHVALPSSTI